MSTNIKSKIKLKVLYLAPHLSTGGMPAFVLKTIQALGNSVEIFVVEYQCHSLDFVVQRNAIKKIVEDNFKTLYENKMELFDVISSWNPDIIHIHDCAERLDRKLIIKLYNNDRTYHIIETCHDVSFKPDVEKIVHPDYYAFCTPYHLETFAHLPSKKEVIEFPIDPLVPKKFQVIEAKGALGLDTNKQHVVNIGLWTSGKNQGEMLELAKKMPDVEFHFVGNQAGNFKDYWEPLMLDVAKNVTIWGERDDIDVFMKAADVFMFNSTWECNPLVLREAISYNKKIIARDLPQYKDMFTPYITNLNPSDLENQLREVLDSDDSYIISESNTTEVFKANLLNLYEKTFKSVVQINDVKDYSITQHFVGQPFLEITGTSDSLFTVEFYDHDALIYRNKIKCNHWVRVNREYFTEWKVLVYKDEDLVYNTVLDYTDKRVYISFESSSLGDTIAWIPYALEFMKKHNCHVIVSTFKNFLFESVYPELEFVTPGTIVNNIQGMYKIGWFYDDNKEPALPNTIPLQQTATNILGLEFQEIKPRIAFTPGNNLYGKYVTIATNSTAGCKFWTKEGWQEVINFLVDKGYKVINVSKEKNPFDNCTQIEDTSMDNTISTIHHSEFTIALSSGLGWLSWILGKQVVMIANFSKEDHEFTCTRITNTNVCHGCWNDPDIKFDKGDWNWCKLKNTPRHFECHRGISAQRVIDVLPI